MTPSPRLLCKLVNPFMPVRAPDAFADGSPKREIGEAGSLACRGDGHGTLRFPKRTISSRSTLRARARQRRQKSCSWCRIRGCRKRAPFQWGHSIFYDHLSLRTDTVTKNLLAAGPRQYSLNAIIPNNSYAVVQNSADRRKVRCSEF